MTAKHKHDHSVTASKWRFYRWSWVILDLLEVYNSHIF